MSWTVIFIPKTENQKQIILDILKDGDECTALDDGSLLCGKCVRCIRVEAFKAGFQVIPFLDRIQIDALFLMD